MKLRHTQSRREAFPRTAEVASAPKNEGREYQFGCLRKTVEEELPQLLQMSTGERWFRPGSWQQNLSTLSFYSVVFPELRDQLRLDDENFADFLRRISELEPERAEAALESLANLYLFNPERRGQMIMADEKHDDFLPLVQPGDPVPKNYPRVLRNYCLLFPDKRAESGADEERKMQNFMAALETLARLQNWFLYAKTLADLFVLYPHLKQEIIIDDDMMDKIETGLRSHFDSTRKYSEDIAEVEWIRAVLMADEVEVGQKGVELINRSRLEQAPELPDRNLAA